MTSNRPMIKVQRVDNESSGAGMQFSTNYKLDEQDSDEEEADQPVQIAKQVVASARARIKIETAG